MAEGLSLRKILGLLDAGTVEESMAAAVLLGSLAPRNASVVQALARQLGREDNLPLALASARALGRIGGPAALRALVPLLETRGDLREAGALAIAGCGKAALPELRKALAGTDFQGREVLYRTLVRLGSPEALDVVLAAFFDPSFEVVKMAGRAFRAEAAPLSSEDRARITRHVLAFLKRKETRASRAATNSALLLLGALARPEAGPALAPYAGAEHPRATRRHALEALAACYRMETPSAALAAELFPLLDEADLELVEPAIAVLDRAPLSSRLEGELRRHLGSRHAAVRRYAVRALARSRTREGAAALQGLLDAADPELRSAAVHALKASPEAPGLLLPRLLAEPQPDRAWDLAHLVKPNAARLTAPERKRLLTAAERALDAGEKRAEAFLHLARHADPQAFYKAFVGRAESARKAKRFEDAERNLRLVSRSEYFDDGARCLLALMTLRAAGEPTPASPRARDAVESLRQLAQAKGFDLLARLRKEKALLGPEGLYAVGFGLTEGPGGASAPLRGAAGDPARELGRKILQDLARAAPRSRIGRMARAKLDTEGLTGRR